MDFMIVGAWRSIMFRLAAFAVTAMVFTWIGYSIGSQVQMQRSGRLVRPPVVDKLVFPAARERPNPQVVRPAGDSLETIGATGAMTLGPLRAMSAGTYRARWFGSFKPASADDAVVFDVYWGGVPHGSAETRPSQVKGEEVSALLAEIPFELKQGAPDFQTRTWINSSGTKLKLDRTEIIVEHSARP
jgi:hypothetical protein